MARLSVQPIVIQAELRSCTASWLKAEETCLSASLILANLSLHNVLIRAELSSCTALWLKKKLLFS